jgi:hypothetical protein
MAKITGSQSTSAEPKEPAFFRQQFSRFDSNILKEFHMVKDISGTTKATGFEEPYRETMLAGRHNFTTLYSIVLHVWISLQLLLEEVPS